MSKKYKKPWYKRQYRDWHQTHRSHKAKKSPKAITELLDEEMLRKWHYDQINEFGVDYLENRGQYNEEGNLVFPSCESPEHRRAYYMDCIESDLEAADAWANSNRPIPPGGFYLQKASSSQVVNACLLALAFDTFARHPLIPDSPRMRIVRKKLCEMAVEKQWSLPDQDDFRDAMVQDESIDWFETDAENFAFRLKVKEWFSQ